MRATLNKIVPLQDPLLHYAEILRKNGIYMVNGFNDERFIVVNGAIIARYYENKLDRNIHYDFLSNQKFKLMNEEIVIG